MDKINQCLDLMETMSPSELRTTARSMGYMIQRDNLLDRRVAMEDAQVAKDYNTLLSPLNEPLKKVKQFGRGAPRRDNSIRGIAQNIIVKNGGSTNKREIISLIAEEYPKLNNGKCILHKSIDVLISKYFSYNSSTGIVSLKA